MKTKLNDMQMQLCKNLELDWQTYEAMILFREDRIYTAKDGSIKIQITPNEIAMCNKGNNILEYCKNIIKTFEESKVKS